MEEKYTFLSLENNMEKTYVTGSLVLQYNIFKNKQTYLKIKHIDISNFNNLLPSLYFQTKNKCFVFHSYSKVTTQHQGIWKILPYTTTTTPHVPSIAILSMNFFSIANPVKEQSEMFFHVILCPKHQLSIVFYVSWQIPFLKYFHF